MYHIPISDPRYPALLREIPNPPQQLYAEGNLDLLTATRTIAIVGSRKATRYGKQVVRNAVPHLVAADCVIVSGLAFGIDAAAHEETVACEGATIAVLGSSVVPEEITPRSNQHIARKILASGGLLLSEYPPGSVAYASHYPERNRIIAGLSVATVVVEGGLRSGSLITARLAVEYNRELFAVPGQITTPLSAGPNRLLTQGAIPWTGHEILFEQLGHLFMAEHSGIDAAAPSGTGATLNGPGAVPKQTLLLTDTERAVLKLYLLEVQTIDQAIQARPDSLQPHQVIQATMSLLMKGALNETSSHTYIAS